MGEEPDPESTVTTINIYHVFEEAFQGVKEEAERVTVHSDDTKLSPTNPCIALINKDTAPATNSPDSPCHCH